MREFELGFVTDRDAVDADMRNRRLERATCDGVAVYGDKVEAPDDDWKSDIAVADDPDA